MIHRERVALPGWVRPMLATAGGLPRSGDGWAFEMKWDGQRASAYIGGGRLTWLLSRTGRDITVAYPELGGLGAAAGARQLVLDGEIVAFDAGRPSFEALQQRMHVASAAQAGRLAGQVPVAYLVFDLLHLDWRPTLELPYTKRRELLEGLGLAGQSWQTPPAFTDAAGENVIAVAISQGLEGVVAKRLDAPYRPGARSADWRKIKYVRRQEVVIGGISPGDGGRVGQIGSLLVGVQDDGRLVYAGRVGTGLQPAGSAPARTRTGAAAQGWFPVRHPRACRSGPRRPVGRAAPGDRGGLRWLDRCGADAGSLLPGAARGQGPGGGHP